MKQDEQKTTVTVTLIMPHRHGGRDYLPGDTIDVTPTQKQWLAEREIIINDMGEKSCQES